MHITVENTSHLPQKEYLTYAMLPESVAKKIPQSGAVDGVDWIFCKGDLFGDYRRIWIRSEEMGPGEKVDLNLKDFILKDSAYRIPPLRIDWLLDRPQDAQLYLKITEGAGQSALVKYEFEGLETASILGDVWRFSISGSGYYSRIYVTLAKGQDIFPYQGYVIWSDRNSREWAKNVTLEIVHGERNIQRLGNSLGQTQHTSNNRTSVKILDSLISGSLPDGLAIPFYGYIAAEKDTDTDEEKKTIQDEFRLSNIRAAAGGPVNALASSGCWDKNIGPHKSDIKSWESRVPINRNLPFDYQMRRSIWDSRQPYGPPRSTGTTGDYGVFGAIKALGLFLDGSPKALDAIRWGATDLACRGIHHLNDDSRPMEFDLTDPRITYGGHIHERTHGHLWNKPNFKPWGVDHGRWYIDPQHRGNLFNPVALIVCGDWIMRDFLDHLIAADSRDSRIRTRAMEAPRAVGRMMQEWAWWYCAAGENQRRHLKELSLIAMNIIERDPGMSVSGPMKVLGVRPPWNGSPLPDLPFWAPWENSLACDGILAWADIFKRTGDQVNLGRFIDRVIEIGNSVIDHGIAVDTNTNNFVVLAYAKYNNGEPNDTNYLRIPRPGAMSGYPHPGQDLSFGGINPYWFSGAALAAAGSGNPKANVFLDGLIKNVRNQSEVEWLVRKS